MAAVTDIDLLSCGARKFGGPPGVGMLLTFEAAGTTDTPLVLIATGADADVDQFLGAVPEVLAEPRDLGR